jgi:hypothetical protein
MRGHMSQNSIAARQWMRHVKCTSVSHQPPHRLATQTLLHVALDQLADQIQGGTRAAELHSRCKHHVGMYADKHITIGTKGQPDMEGRSSGYSWCS